MGHCGAAAHFGALLACLMAGRSACWVAPDVISPPHVGSLFPLEGPKEGGTMIRVEGEGFVDNADLQCRFSRTDPATKLPIHKTVSAAFVSSSAVLCESPTWDEDECPTCDATPLAGTFSGHSGSRYMRSTDAAANTYLGAGSFLKLAGGTTGHGGSLSPLTQTFQVQSIEPCTGVGCVCTGTWQESAYSTTQSFDSEGYEIILATDNNNAMYKYDALQDVPKPDPVCNGGTWSTGSKIVLSEAVFKVPGTANVFFSEKSASSSLEAHSCTSCKCAGGCVVSIAVTNDGKAYSGSGTNGESWTGSVVAFSVKDVVPTVHYITHGVPGFRDSTRIVGPITGGTVIHVHGMNFQKSPHLECYFALPLPQNFRATWISETEVSCVSPPFISQHTAVDGVVGVGAAKTPSVKVQITNNGKWGDGGLSLSQNPYLDDDGSYAYIRAANLNTWVREAASGNAFRSTCKDGRAPNYQDGPCRGAHIPGESRGNDVRFTYEACYDAEAAHQIVALTAGTAAASLQVTNSFSLGQVFTIPGYDPLTSNTAGVGGPISYLRLYLQKASAAEAVVEVSISATAFKTRSGTMLTKQDLVISSVLPETAFDVFFSKKVYLKPGVQYFVELKWKSGAQDLIWVHTDGGNDAYNAATGLLTNAGRLKMEAYGCGGCRLAYVFDPAADHLSAASTLGKMSSEGVRQVVGGKFEDSTSLKRSMLAQEFTTKVEVTTMTHVYLKLNTTQARMSIWLTQYGKHGDNVCTSLGAQHTRLSKCDATGAGLYNSTCTTGDICNPMFLPNGGCGDTGACLPAPVLTNGHLLTEMPSDSKDITTLGGWVEFEFAVPVTLERFTKYFISAAVVGNFETSAETVWYSGNRAPADDLPHSADAQLGLAYTRAPGTWLWSKLPDCASGTCTLALKFTQCTTALPGLLSLTTSTNHQTGCCSFRASPRGGNFAVTFQLTGRNIVPSNDLACIFLNENNEHAASVPGRILNKTTDGVVTMQCTTPALDPHILQNCTQPGSCQGVGVIVTNDGINFGTQAFGPKWDAHGVPLYHAAHHQHKVLFSELYVSESGSDLSGDGSRSRPFKSMQRSIDVAHPSDGIHVLPGTYDTCKDDKGLRSHGKSVEISIVVQGTTKKTDTYIDCQRLNRDLTFNNIVQFSGYS